MIALRILRHALEMPEPVHMVCDEGASERLLAELADHWLDLVLSEAPLPPTLRVKAYSHLLGRSPTTLFVAPGLAARYRKNFPASLDGAPFFLPMESMSLRRDLDHWFDSQQIHPKVVAQFKDRAVMSVFARAGGGIFAAPGAIERQIQRNYGLAAIGRVGRPDVSD